MLFVNVLIETGIIYLAASRAKIEHCTLYLCLGLAAAEVAAFFFWSLVLIEGYWLGPAKYVWATYGLSLLVLLGLMAFLLEGGLGQKLYAWFLASVGIIAWKLLSELLMRWGTAQFMAAVLSPSIHLA